MLYNLPVLVDKEWYRWGAEALIANQMQSGAWPGATVQREGFHTPTDFGPTINTAFALLFLKHSHPMKDLTKKFTFTTKELNEGIARFLRSEPIHEHPVSKPSFNKTQSP